MNLGIIYLHKNKENNRCYVGSTIQKNPERRWRRIDKSYRSYKSCPVFYRALKKYGWSGFDTIILETNVSFNQISEREEFYIKEYNSIAPNGYNTVEIIEGRVKYKDATKRKLSKKRKEYYANLEIPIIALNRKPHLFIDGIEHKECPKCKKYLHLENFSKNIHSWDNLRRYCKVCDNTYRKKYEMRLDKNQLEESYRIRKTVSRPFIGISPSEEIKFASGKEASRNGYDKTQIRRSILKNKEYKGYMWRYGDEEPNRKIYARKCEIKEIVNPKEERDFLNKYHRQGYHQSKIVYGLYYNDELVQLMSFGKPRFNKKSYQWEIIRLCSRGTDIIIGGASKLFNHFLKEQNPKNVLTYAHINYSKAGKVYEILGFKFIKETQPGYIWKNTESKVELPRYKTQKHKLSKLLGNLYNPEKTENENMTNAGYEKIYISGNKIYEWKR